MSKTNPFILFPHARLAEFATAALPAWLWAEDATRILWANATAATIFGAPTPAALGERHFDAGHPAAIQVRRLAGSLPEGEAPRLERLRGFAAGIGRTLMCRCARLVLGDGTPAILVIAAEPAGQSLTLAERVRLLLDDLAGSFAAFSPDGELLYASSAARQRLGAATTLAAIGAGALGTTAVDTGSAGGDTAFGPVTLTRIGSGVAMILLASFESIPEPVSAPEPDHTDRGIPEMTPEQADRAVPDRVPAEAPLESVASASEPAQVEPSATLPEPEGDLGAIAAALPDVTAGSADGSAVAAETAPLPVVPAHPAPVRLEPVPRLAERRQPLRFVWQTDADGRFTVASDEFTALIGSATVAALGRPWTEVAAELGLDPEGRIAPALDSHDTFSGIAIAWPIEGTPERLAVELSGLPVFDRERTFRGYRGFGICRDVARLAAIGAARRLPFAPAVEFSTEPAAERAHVEESTGASAPPAAVPDAPSPAEVSAVVPAPSGPPEAAETALTQSAPAEMAEAVPTPQTPDHRPVLTVVPAAENVVPFRSASPQPGDKRAALTPVERNAFQEIAKALGARVEGTETPHSEPDARGVVAAAQPPLSQDAGAAEPAAVTATLAPMLDTETGEPGHPGDDGNEAKTSASSGKSHRVRPRPIPSAYAAGAESASVPASLAGNGERAVLDRLPVGVLVYRGDTLLHANRALLEWTGYEDVEAVAAAGGLERLFAEPGVALLGEPGGAVQILAVTTRRGESVPVEGRLFSIPWHDGTALVIVLVQTEAGEKTRAAEEAARAAEELVKAAEAATAMADERLKASELALRAAQATSRELESVLDTATDGVVVVDRDGLILSSNRSAEALFGYESREIRNRSFIDLFAPESHRGAYDYLNGLMRNGVASVLNDGREVIGRVQQGGLIPLFMTIGRMADGTDKFCVVFRDISQWKRAEEDLTRAQREAEKASSAKSDFLAKISHEIRTPLTAVIGFAEVMMEERFGPVGNERYRQYLKDMRTSGEHVISLVNDLLDLSKIEAGKLALTFVSVNLNDLVQQCVAVMQPQANRERIIIRTSPLPTLPPVVADERSIRQVVLNLLSNSIKHTGAGGQIIVSTALTDQGEAVLRVRDTGTGMSEKELQIALEPFGQVATSGHAGSGGTGLGLPLTKALAEANRASFTMKSSVDSGTLAEIAFPSTRVLAE